MLGSRSGRTAAILFRDSTALSRTIACVCVITCHVSLGQGSPARVPYLSRAFNSFKLTCEHRRALLPACFPSEFSAGLLGAHGCLAAPHRRNVGQLVSCGRDKDGLSGEWCHAWAGEGRGAHLLRCTEGLERKK